MKNTFLAFVMVPCLCGLLGLGCAKLSPMEAQNMTSEELCKVYTGLGTPPKNRRTAYAELQDRQHLCSPDAYDQRMENNRNLNRPRINDLGRP